MSTIRSLLAKHHDHCDELFASTEEAANADDWPLCAERLREFASALESHFIAEETLLFPAFEAATGMSGGPTTVMRGEHVQMRELVAALGQATHAGAADDFFGASETLVIFMEQHNRKEEGILYPMCDERIESPSALAERLGHELEATT